MTRLKRWLKRLGIALMVAGAFTVIAYLYCHHRIESAAENATTAMDVAEPGWRVRDMEAARADVPEDKNGAVVVTKAHGLMSRQWFRPDVNEFYWEYAPVVRLNEAWARTLQVELDARRDAVLEARKLVDRPNGRYPLYFAPEMIETPLPHLSRVYAVENLLNYDAQQLAHHGAIHQAMQSCISAIHAARSIGDEPVCVSQKVRMFAVTQCCRTIERVLGQGECTGEDLAALQRLLEREEKHPALEITYRAGRAWFHETLLALEAGKTPLSACRPSMCGNRYYTWQEKYLWFYVRDRVRAEHPKLFPLMADYLAAGRLSDRERGTVIDSLRLRDRTDKSNAVVCQLVLPLRDLETSYSRYLANLRCLTVAIAAERYRLRHGKWPVSPELLTPHLLAAVPVDPFNGRPLHFKTHDGGIEIWSVGPIYSSTFSAEQPHDGTLFQLWQPSQRYQPEPAGPPQDRSAALVPPKAENE
jgi:hypothetical protein